MKIKILIILLILFHFSCQKEKSELQRSWILVKNQAKPNARFIPVLRGQLFHFKKDKFYFSYPPSKEEFEESYFVDGEYIKTDSSVLGKILHLSKDSLIIETDANSYDMHFRPLEEIEFSKVEKEKIFKYLTNNPWKLYDKQLKYNYKFYFNEKDWGDRYEGNKWTKYLVYENQIEDDKWFSESEWWTLKEFKGKLLFCYSSNSGTEVASFQITDFSEDEISGQLMNWYDKNWKSNSLEKVTPPKDLEVKDMKKYILGNWQIGNLIKPTPEEILFIRDSLQDKSNGAQRSRKRFKNRISIFDLEEDNLKFQFLPDGKYQILADDKIIREGKEWGITKDGKYLYLDSEITGGNFIEILSIKENLFKIKFLDKIGIPKNNPLAFTWVNLEIELKKEVDIEH